MGGRGRGGLGKVETSFKHVDFSSHCIELKFILDAASRMLRGAFCLKITQAAGALIQGSGPEVGMWIRRVSGSSGEQDQVTHTGREKWREQRGTGPQAPGHRSWSDLGEEYKTQTQVCALPLGTWSKKQPVPFA